MKIIEATEREFMTKKEQLLKKKLIALLKDDGKGHKHAKYAARLEDFIIKIVDSKEDPEMTAAVSFDEATIYISDGFLKDPETFYQLNVLMRHELAHYLMQHQIRMMHKIIDKYGEDGYTRIKMSHSIHHILNIIEDFEISNTRYSEADKSTVRNMMLNCELIGGLVTEDHRTTWQKMSVIDMYEAITEEINGIQQSILARWQQLDLNNIVQKDFVHRNIVGTLHKYLDTQNPTNFLGSIEDFLKNKALYHFALFDKRTKNGIRPCIVKYSSLPDVYQNIISDIYNLISTVDPTTNQPFTKQAVRNLITEVAQSNPMVVYEYKNYFKLYTPEEKFIAVDTLKAMLSTLELYQTWYDKVKRVLGDTSKYSREDLEKILAAIEN